MARKRWKRRRNGRWYPAKEFGVRNNTKNTLKTSFLAAPMGNTSSTFPRILSFGKPPPDPGHVWLGEALTIRRSTVKSTGNKILLQSSAALESSHYYCVPAVCTAIAATWCSGMPWRPLSASSTVSINVPLTRIASDSSTSLSRISLTKSIPTVKQLKNLFLNHVVFIFPSLFDSQWCSLRSKRRSISYST